MKKIFLIIMVVLFVASSADLSAQTQRNTEVKLTLEEKMQIAHSSEELNTQLTKEFGEDYSLNDKLVLNQLKMNIVNPNLTRDLRKTSLLLYYGEEYQSHIDLINNEK